MKINDYESTSSLFNDDNFIIETSVGTRKASAELLKNEILNGITIRQITVSRTIPANNRAEFDFSEYMDADDKLVGVFCKGGRFNLPYMDDTGVITTVIYRTLDQGCVIRNTGNSAWTDYIWEFVLFSIKVPEETQALE